MPQWDQGYPAGVEYVKLAKSELSPAHITFCLALSGKETAALDGPFTYAELGAGFGLAVAGWAAQYPRARFHCIDYNPAQTAWTRRASAAAGLENLTVHTAPVEQMLEKDLPPFDFIVLHGLYSWVPETVRADIRRFLRRFLAPGGCVYVSYNCMPGNKDTEAMRRLLGENAEHLNGMRHHRKVDESLALLRELKACGAAFFTDSPQAAVLLDTWTGLDPDYLVGELMPREHASFYFSQVHAAMGEAGLRWSGSAGVRHHLADMAISHAMRDLLESRGRDPVFRETLKDFYFNTAFRQDLFCHGARSSLARPPWEALEGMRFCLNVHRDLPARPPDSPLRRLTLDSGVNRSVQAALAPAPATLAQIVRFTGLGRESVLEALTVLVGFGLVWPFAGTLGSEEGTGEKNGEEQARYAAVKRLNLFLLQTAPGEDRIMLLSANGGWITNWDPLVYAYQTARLTGSAGEDVARRMKRKLREEERRAQGWAVDGHGGSPGETVEAFLREHGPEMEAFARRHGWA